MGYVGVFLAAITENDIFHTWCWPPLTGTRKRNEHAVAALTYPRSTSHHYHDHHRRRHHHHRHHHHPIHTSLCHLGLILMSRRHRKGQTRGCVFLLSTNRWKPNFVRLLFARTRSCTKCCPWLKQLLQGEVSDAFVVCSWMSQKP